MKPRQDPFETNVHDTSGKAGLPCPKCKKAIPPKPGFRPSALKCPACGCAPRR